MYYRDMITYEFDQFGNGHSDYFEQSLKLCERDFVQRSAVLLKATHRLHKLGFHHSTTPWSPSSRPSKESEVPAFNVGVVTVSVYDINHDWVLVPCEYPCTEALVVAGDEKLPSLLLV